MAANERYLMISFTKEDEELFRWIMAHDLRVSRSVIGREAIEVYRLFSGSLSEAQEARKALDEKRQNNTGENNA